MSSSNSNSYSNSYSYGIYNTSTGLVYIGLKDGNINKESITIEADIGMYNSQGKLSWYDGTVIYTTRLLQGSVTEIEDNAQIVENDGKGYLQIVESIEWIQNVTTGKQYRDLQTAIEETNVQDTLQVLEDYTQYEEVIINEEKQIVLDFNGKTVTTYGSLCNQGELQITDNFGNGMMISQVGTTMIRNTGTLEVRGGMVSSSDSITGGYSSTCGISNNGEGRVTISRRNCF